jgi:hypothetical protein
MRALCLFAAGGLCLLLASCGGKTLPPNDVTPVSKYRELIGGKWEADNDRQLVQTYEFGPEDKLTVTVKGMKEPIHGTYHWVGDKEVELEYQAPADQKKDYAAAIKARKQPDEQMARGQGPIADAVRKSLEAIPDELPEKEKAKVILAEKPREVLIVETERGMTLDFNRPSGK